jgi:hypothetical protein
MKSITRLSFALMMFSLFSISYLVTSVAAHNMDHDIGTYINDCVKRNNVGQEGAIAECKRLHNSFHVVEPRRWTRGMESADEAPKLEADLVRLACRNSEWGKGDVRIVGLEEEMCTQGNHIRLGESFPGQLRPVKTEVILGDGEKILVEDARQEEILRKEEKQKDVWCKSSPHGFTEAKWRDGFGCECGRKMI